MEFLVNRILLILCLTLVAASFILAGPADARESRQEDYCTRGADVCITQCGQYNFTLFGVDWPSPRTALCVGECTVAYVGCIMMRFRVGV